MKYITITIVSVAIIAGIVVWLRTAPQQPVVQTTTVTPETATVESTATTSTAVAPVTEPKKQVIIKTITTKTGMKIETTQEGTGEAIVNGKIAQMEYTGMLTDGTVFDATSRHGGEPFEFTLGAGQVIKGWDQGVLGMKVGESRRLTIPADLAYGSQGIGGVIPPNATLVFDVTLKGIK